MWFGRFGSEICIIFLLECMVVFYSLVVEFMYIVGKILMEIVEIIVMIIFSRL